MYVLVVCVVVVLCVIFGCFLGDCLSGWLRLIVYVVLFVVYYWKVWIVLWLRRCLRGFWFWCCVLCGERWFVLDVYVINLLNGVVLLLVWIGWFVRLGVGCFCRVGDILGGLCCDVEFVFVGRFFLLGGELIFWLFFVWWWDICSDVWCERWLVCVKLWLV